MCWFFGCYCQRPNVKSKILSSFRDGHSTLCFSWYVTFSENDDVAILLDLGRALWYVAIIPIIQYDWFYWCAVRFFMESDAIKSVYGFFNLHLVYFIRAVNYSSVVFLVCRCLINCKQAAIPFLFKSSRDCSVSLPFVKPVILT